MPEIPRALRGKEEFIAVVFGNEVWMGLVDFKSDKPQSEDAVGEDLGTTNRQILTFSSRSEEMLCRYSTKDIQNPYENF
jgi:hypothetical protein